jgi:hypothetical protein
MADQPICPCDDAPTQFTIVNPPGRDHIGYRIGDFVSFRHALLKTLGSEPELENWRPSASGDLAVQMLEWWAYLGDILTFYNERIANETFLRTAILPESLNRLIRTIGYRPRPGIAAHGQVVALVGGHRPLTLPRGFSLDSKPGPGETPQTFELDVDTTVKPDGTVPAAPPAFLFSPATTAFLVAAAGVPVAAGAVLMLSSRTAAFEPVLLSVTGVATETGENGKARRRVSFTASGALPDGATAGAAQIRFPAQSMPVWGEAAAIEKGWGGAVVHLAGVARDLRPGDYDVFTAPNTTPELRQVTAATDVVWYANHDRGASPETPPTDTKLVPIPVLHTQLSFSTLNWTGSPDETTVRFGWRSVGQLLDQPAADFSGTPGALLARSPAAFPSGTGASIIVAGALGDGATGLGTPSSDGGTLAVTNLLAQPALKAPLTVHYNLLAISRGKTVANEVLGDGDASVPAQEFVLKKSPLTYLAKGDGYVSTLSVWINGRQWQEAKSFYQQPAGAEIFVTREDENQNTHVQFGDGINGARLPTGVNNVIATYRYGSGAKAPQAGEITVINKPYPNLKSVQNPVPVGDGADPDPPDQIRLLAPGSVMTFGRAVSGDDYEVIAARAPGVTRAQAVWSYDAIEQRSAVKIYVGDDAAAVDSARAAIAATGDPHRHVVVTLATEVDVVIGLQVLFDGRYLADDIRTAVRSAMLDDDRGVFGVRRLGIGQAVFDSEIAAACLGCEGVVALRQIFFFAKGASGFFRDLAPRHAPGEGAFYRLDPQSLIICPEATQNAG